MNNSSIQVFSFESQEVRTVNIDGAHWFVLRDVLAAMGSSTPPSRAAESILDGLGGGVNDGHPIVDSLGRTQQVTVISEAAVTFLVARSNTDLGKLLNRWIHNEVLPSIRKTGGYTLQRAPQTYIEALEVYVASEKARIAAEEQAALVLQRANELSDEVEQLSEVVDELFGYSSVIRIAKYNGVSERRFSWRDLKDAAKARGLDIKTVPCPRFKTKNLYPHEAWADCYPDMELPSRESDARLALRGIN